MRIGEMVRRTGVSERMLRYYEEQGLLSPERLPSGYRVYRDADVGTVRRVRALLAAGLSTTTIAEVLPCVREDGAALVPVCPDLVARLRGERERIGHVIEDLRASQEMLDAVISARDFQDLRGSGESQGDDGRRGLPAVGPGGVAVLSAGPGRGR